MAALRSRPYVVRDRAPALHDPRRRPDPGDGGRRDRRAGHHDGLLAADGAYARLYNAQFAAAVAGDRVTRSNHFGSSLTAAWCADADHRGTARASRASLLDAAPDRPAPLSRWSWSTVHGLGRGGRWRATLTSQGPVEAKPTVVEFSPYGRQQPDACASAPTTTTCSSRSVAPATATARFDALGRRTQRDVVEVLEWACAQPFSDGRLALDGFSASAIVLYNTLAPGAAVRRGRGTRSPAPTSSTATCWCPAASATWCPVQACSR